MLTFSAKFDDMPEFKIDPFDKIRKNAHVWRGENAIIWYQEAMDGSYTVLTLTDFGDKKSRLFLAVNKNGSVEFKNDELPPDQYEHLKNEIEIIEKLLDTKLV